MACDIVQVGTMHPAYLVNEAEHILYSLIESVCVHVRGRNVCKLARLDQYSILHRPSKHKVPCMSVQNTPSNPPPLQPPPDDRLDSHRLMIILRL
jgi:hypothetical protein